MFGSQKYLKPSHEKKKLKPNNWIRDFFSFFVCRVVVFGVDG